MRQVAPRQPALLSVENSNPRLGTCSMCVCDVGWTLSMDSSECNVPYTRIDVCLGTFIAPAWSSACAGSYRRKVMVGPRWLLV
jgi:hypothetical protein